MKKLAAILMILALLPGSACGLAGENAGPAQAEEGAAGEYTLEQVVILSRHNLRAPLSSNGSVPSELTPHAWIRCSARW